MEFLRLPDKAEQKPTKSINNIVSAVSVETNIIVEIIETGEKKHINHIRQHSGWLSQRGQTYGAKRASHTRKHTKLYVRIVRWLRLFVIKANMQKMSKRNFP